MNDQQAKNEQRATNGRDRDEQSLARLEALFQAAADLPVEARGPYLDTACGGSPALRARVEAMLAQLDDDTPLPPPVAGVGVGEDASGLPEAPGTVIDRYRLLDVLGEGAFGVVYRAAQLAPVEREVAFKVIKLGMDTREVVARFEAERQALALMEHPAIATVFDGGATAAGRPYFVMELVPGEAITTYCVRRSLGLKPCLRLFVAVCRAVEHAHQKGVIHRDLKPSNVLVAEHDGAPLPKIIDFGVAKAIHTRLTTRTLLTEARHLIGTPAYMSPEQARLRERDVDTRTDVYALGVLLYELLTGTTPFDPRALEVADLAAVQRIIGEEEPLRPSRRVRTKDPSRSRQLRGDLDWIVTKALAKERARRYATASALADDVERYLASAPVMAGPPSTAYRLRTWLRRHRTAAGAAALVLVALIAGLVAAAAGLLEAARQRDLARREAAHAVAALDFLDDTLALTDPEVARDPEVSVRTLLDRAALTVEAAFADRPAAEARVRTTIGRAYASLGASALAEVHLRRAVALMDGLEQPDPVAHYTALWALTHVLFRLERDDGYALARRARRVAHDHIGTKHPNLAAALDAFTRAVEEAAFTAEEAPLSVAQERFKAAVQVAETSLPPGDPLWPLVGDTFLAAGLQFWYTPHEAASKAFYAQALAIQRRSRPADDPEIGKTLGLLVGVLNRAGHPVEAEARIRDAIAQLRGIYPEDHFQVAFATSLLGANLSAQGRYTEAEPLLLNSHGVIRATVEDEAHFFVIESLNRLIDLYASWEREEEAAPYRSALAQVGAVGRFAPSWILLGAAFGPEHAALGKLLATLEAQCGGALYKTGDGEVTTTLDPLLDNALALRRATLPDDHPLAALTARLFLGWANALAPGAADDSRRRLVGEALTILRRWQEQVPLATAEGLAQLALLDLAAGNAVAAAEQARVAWTLVREAYGDDHWTAVTARVRVGRCLLAQGLYAEAESLLVPGLEVLTAQLGANHSEVEATRQLVIDLYTAWDRPEQARAYRARTPAAGPS